MSEAAAESPEPTPAEASATDDRGRAVAGARPSGELAHPVRSSTRSAGPLPRRRSGSAGATGRGVLALILVATALAGLVDIATSGHRGHLFGVVFAVTSALGALVVRRRDLPTAMVAPPLLYCVLIALMSLVDRGGLSGGPLTTEVYYLGNAFVTGAPAIWSGTALACAIGWYRRRSARR